jgi:hypothetical protein
MPCNITYLNFFNINYIIQIVNCTSAIKPSVTEQRENCILWYQCFRNFRIAYTQFLDVILWMISTYGISLLCGTFWVIISDVNYVIQMKPTGIYIYYFCNSVASMLL